MQAPYIAVATYRLLVHSLYRTQWKRKRRFLLMYKGDCTKLYKKGSKKICKIAIFFAILHIDSSNKQAYLTFVVVLLCFHIYVYQMLVLVISKNPN